MRTKRVLSISAVLVLAAVGFASATVRVTNLQLQKSSQFTEFTLVCDGPCEFSHQIVEAAANKPFRIVVDAKDAILGLPQHAYTNLPANSIKQIRTSQYSTDPQKVVRIVLDVTGQLTYKVKNDANSITLMINTPSDKEFPLWSALSGQSGSVTAKNDSPKPMPAYPGTEANAPKVDNKQPEKQDLKLAAKPVDEGKLLNKSGNPSTSLPATNTAESKSSQLSSGQKSEPSSNPSVGGAVESSQPQLAEKHSGKTVKDSKTTVNPVTTPQSTSTISPAKAGDSAIMPPSQPVQKSPAGTPADQTKPPKAQKNALPDNKALPTPKTAETSPANAPLTNKLATTAQANSGTTASAQPVSPEQTDSAKSGSRDSLRLKSEAVHQRYLAKQGRAAKEQEALYVVDSNATIADTTGTQREDKIDKIRNKYKRGIKFFQNDEDEEQQQSEAESENNGEGDQTANQGKVGPYNEFLPEREVVVYVSGGNADPFLPLLEDATQTARGGELPNVETLRLVGILQAQKISRALFEDYNGYSYILKTGDRVKNGFVLAIEETRVLFQIRQYGWNRQVALDLDHEK